jgi:predicted ATPase/signal transduction histidine kinase/CheY-like chemotaxis protein
VSAVLAIEDLTIDPPFYESKRSVIFHARHADGRRFIVKAIPPGELTAANVAYLRHEHRMLVSVDSPHVPKVFGFVYTRGSHAALVLEDIGARGNLESFPAEEFDLATVLDIGIAAASALEAVHRKGITHYAVKPRHLIWAPESKRLQLIDFAVAMRLETANPELSGHEDPVGTLPYLSPEQTGRMNCGVDYRSDLYSLGIVFYRLLANTLPFDAKDPLGWIHAHIATRAVPLHERDSAIPAAVSAIVERLMDKDRERRYQSAAGLLADLRRCAELLAETGTIPEFELGQTDRSDRFHIPDRLYGRDEQIEVLLGAFDRVAAGSRAGLILLAGAPGIGKSSLVHELQRPLALRGGTIISGKFDLLQRTTPLTGIIAAFEDLVGQLLKQPDELLTARRETILAAIGPSGRVLTDLVPSLELVLGPQPPVAATGDVERLNRFKLVIERFIGALAQPDHPLVFFIDDLHRADRGSLAVFEHILRSDESRSMVMIGTYRSNEVDAVHPLTQMLARLAEADVDIQRLELGPIGLRDVEHLLADTLRCPPDAVRELAVLVHDKTGGNPFFLRQFLVTLHRARVIAFDHARGSWTWDVERGATQASTDNVGDLLVQRFAQLPHGTQRLLQLAAFIGNRFDLRTLATVGELGFVETFVELWPSLEQRLLLAESGVLARLRDVDADTKTDSETDTETALVPEEAARMLFRFCHDRIQQAAAASGHDSRGPERIHLEIGRTLRRHLDAEEQAARMFEIADQLNAGGRAIDTIEERLGLVELNLACGRRALEATAYESAVEYLELAAELLDMLEPHAEDRKLWFGVHLELARASYLAGRYDAATREYPELLRRAVTDDERLAVHAVRIEHAMLTGPFQAGVAACRAVLAIRGIALPTDERALWQLADEEIAKVEVNLRGRNIADLIDAPRLENQAQLRVLDELGRCLTLTYQAGSWALHSWSAARMTNISLVHGHARLSSLGYTFFAFVMAMRGRYEWSRAFGRLGIAVRHRLLGPTVFDRADSCYYGLSAHFHMPLREISQHLYRAHPIAVERGDVAYASYDLLIGDFLELSAGAPLASMRETIVRHLPFFMRSSPGTLQLYYVPYMVFVVCALSGVPTTEVGFEFDSDTFLETMAENGIVGWHHAGRIKVEALTGVVPGVEVIRAGVEAVEAGVPGQFLVPEARFYAALQLLELLRRDAPEHARLDDEKRQRAEQLVEDWRRQAQVWAEVCPANFRFMYLLIEAERARNRGLLREAMLAYEQAIDAAREYDYIDQEALGRRLYGEFWLDQRAATTANAHLAAAFSLYAEWGAQGILRVLQARHPRVGFATRPSGSASEQAPSRSTDPRPQLSERLDLETVSQAARAVSSETTLDGLLDKLAVIIRENVGASRCLILRQRDGQWVVAATSSNSETPDDGSFSLAVANYASRSGEILLLDEPASASRWFDDEYIRVRRPRSLLCAPVRLEDRLLALVYAENELTARAFGDRHMTLLHTVLAQAAISLENVRLFDALKHEQQRWHSLVRNAADLILVVESDHRVEFVNHATASFVLAPLVGTRIEDSFPPDERARLRAAIDQVFATGERGNLDSAVEGPDGLRDLTLRVGPIRSAGLIERVSLIATDVSEQRLLANQLRQSQKMEAVGTLAGGIAHDFNNLLTVILGACDLGRLAGAEGPVQELFSEITEAGERAADLTRNLLAFSRKQVLQPEVAELDGLVEKLTRMLGRMLGEDIELSLLLASEGGRVRIDRSGLEQVIMNLAINARDAMPRGGHLVIRTRRVREHDRHYLALEVCDDGVGMDALTRERIFDPFFTTKAAGRGTGLGLAMVHGIVEQSGGLLRVESELGRGTRFTILLPEHVGDEERRAASETMMPMPKGSETILLVEDDQQLRGLVVNMLEQLGYTVMAAANADAALASTVDTPHIDLLFTDVVMPGLSGPELAERLTHRYPGLATLFTSGYTNDEILRHGVRAGTVTLLPKPFTISAMARKVREILDGPRAR